MISGLEEGFKIGPITKLSMDEDPVISRYSPYLEHKIITFDEPEEAEQTVDVKIIPLILGLTIIDPNE